MRRALFICLLGWWPLLSICQSTHDVLGEWEGYITQTPAGLADRYPFWLRLYDSKEGIVGESTIAMPDDEEAWGRMNVKVEWEEGLLRVTELEIVAQQLYVFAYWCIKAYDLRPVWVDGVLQLDGEWVSGHCGGSVGTVHLERRLT